MFKRDEAWLQKENVWTDSLAELVKDKGGIAIDPKKLVNFGGVKLGLSSEIPVQVTNKTLTPIPLKSIIVQGDQYVCKFNIVLPCVKECEDFITMLEPNSVFDFKVSIQF